ncbi:MAG: sirohydrochlorin chelatase [Nocardiopsaceae bacterium]|nr:sirohydrochlorin chelatase [Nocardiopsaceae bacterium]
MRHPRIAKSPPLVAVAHGSRDPRAAATVGNLLAVVRDRAVAQGLPGLCVRTAFLDHATPSLPQVLGSLAPEHDECVVVPLLLTAAYHTEKDIPRQIAKTRSAYPGLDVVLAGPLGPHRLLLRALDRRLAQAWRGPRPETSVVLAAAGSASPSANATNAALATELQETGGWRRVVTGYASAASPSAAEAVTALRAEGGPVVVATYLLAPGYFAGTVRDTSLAAGASAVSDPLGAAPEVADVIIRGYLAGTRVTSNAPADVTSIPPTG